MALDLQNYQYGLGFLHKWFLRSSAFPTGTSGETRILSTYTDQQIATIGALAKNYSEQRQQFVISKALSNYPTGTPRTVDWTDYFMSEAADLNYTDIVTAGLKDTAIGVAKATAWTAAFGGTAYLLWVGVPVVMLLLAKRKK